MEMSKTKKTEKGQPEHYPQYSVKVKVVENHPIRNCVWCPVGHEYEIQGVKIKGWIPCLNAHASIYKNAFAMRYGVIFPETHDAKTGAIYVSCTENEGWPAECKNPVIFELKRGELIPNPKMDKQMREKKIEMNWK